MIDKENHFVTIHGNNGKSWVMHDSQFDKEQQDKERQIQYNISEKKKKTNEEIEKNLDESAGEYKYEYSRAGYDIIHFHLKDSSIYQVWKNDVYLDEAESTGELSYILKELGEKE